MTRHAVVPRPHRALRNHFARALAGLLGLEAAAAFAAGSPPVTVAVVPMYSPPSSGGLLGIDQLVRAGETVFFYGEGRLEMSRDGRAWSTLTLPEGGDLGVLAATTADVLDVAWVAPVNELWHSRSTDGGASWSPGRLVLSGIAYGASVATSLEGTIAMTAVTTANVSELVLSSDGGATFSAPVILAAGREPTTIAWTATRGLLACWWGAEGPLCQVSRDGGLSFGPQRVAAGVTDLLQLSGLAPGVAGDVWIAYLSRVQPEDSLVLGVARSLDGGETWLQTSLGPVATVTNPPFVVVDPAGRLWAGVYGDQYGRPTTLFTSRDGTSWSEIAGSPCRESIVALAAPRADELVAFGVGKMLRAGPMFRQPFFPVLARSTDGGVSFSTQEIRGYHDIAGPWLERTASGRLLAAWIEGGLRGVTASAAHSDDEGATWSERVGISDVPVALSSEVALASMPDGGAVAAWVARTDAGCSELRVSRSRDGDSFESSVTAAEATSATGVSIGADAAGRVVLIWRDGSAYFSAFSRDGGATWSPPAEPAAFIETSWDPSRLLRTADDALTYVAVTGDPACRWCTTVAFRTQDGGASWRSAPLQMRTRPPALIVAVGAGSQLSAQVLSYESCPFDVPCEDVNFILYRSEDGGESWYQTPVPNWGGLYWDPSLMFAGDELGNVYFRIGPQDSLGLRRADGRLQPLKGGFPDFVRAVSPPLVRSPSELAMIGDAVTSAGEPDRVLFWRMGQGLQRDDSIAVLDPRPDLSVRFPPPEYLTFGAAPGMLDPDETVLTDANRPLVLYGLPEADGNRLQVARSGDRVRLTW